jgi:hypothetical protein
MGNTTQKMEKQASKSLYIEELATKLHILGSVGPK